LLSPVRAAKRIHRGADVNSLQLLLKKCFQQIALLPLFLLLAVSNAPAADVKIAWDANTESDLAGYKLFYGTTSRSYLNSIDVGNTTEYTLTGLIEGTTYYFAAKAYDTSDNESDYSQELVYTLPTINSAPDTPAKPTGPASGFVQTSYAFNTSGTDPDGDLLTYRFDWGDGNISAWGGAYSRTHAFSSVGTYCIKAQSQDSHSAASGWSTCLNVSIDIQRHTITASAGTNGSISPAGSVTVTNGADQAFSINPDQSYRVADVVVDGSSVGALTTYTFENVDSDHTIAAGFVADNQPPVSNAGADQAVRVSDTVQLDGGNSSDPNGDTLTYSWSFISRPSGSNVTLSSANAVKPAFVVDVAGSYTLRLIVNDGTVNSAPDTVVVTTLNSAPISRAGVDQAVLVNDTVQLDGSGSSDIDGDSLTYHWSFVSRPGGSSAALSNSKAAQPTFTADVAGAYTVQLIVNDGTVNGVPDTVVITTLNSAPISRAGPDQAVLVKDTVQLDGSNSSDADGDSLTYKWTFVSRPIGSNAALSSTSAVRPTFVVDVAGTYTVQLIVNDGTVNSAPDSVMITTENSAPISNAGADQTVLVKDTVQLDGSGSSDLDGDMLTFKWSFVSRPDGSDAELSNTGALKPTFGVDVAGSYTVQLIVNDGTADSAADTVTISTENSVPVANAGADQAVLAKDTVQLDGSGSSDVDGDMLTFKWSFVAKPAGSNAALSDINVMNPTLAIDVAGSYTVQLIVNDGTADSAADTVTISTENSAPVANAGADQAVLVNDTVQLDGSGAGDVDGDSLTYKWSFVSRPAGSNAALSNTIAVNPTFVVDAPGTYTVQLIVNDGTVSSAPDTAVISTENSAPVGNAGIDQAVSINDTVQLNGSGSSDADGDTLAFSWSFVSRPGGSEATLFNAKTVNPNFVIDVAGTYTVQLIVNDGTASSVPDTVTISTVNSVPVSNAGNDQTVEEGYKVTLSGSNSTDPDHNITGYLWQQTGGTEVALSTPDKSETTFVVPTVLTDGEKLTFSLTVTDAGGLSDVDTCVVQIAKPVAVDSDGDGVSDDNDAFPLDPQETIDTDGDGLGNNTDEDDDNDGMPDVWETSYGLNPLQDDSAEDPDGDGTSNINEYSLGSKPNYFEGNFQPDPPALLAPENNDTVGLTPLLRTDEFSDPNANDVHRKTHWKVIRAFDSLCVLDVTSSEALTAMTMPRQILEANTEYIWKARFFDSHDTPSEWSAEREFTTADARQDLNENGVPDDQEVAVYQDLDLDGTADIVQDDIRCVNVAEQNGSDQICVSIRGAENVYAIASLEAEDPDDFQLVSNTRGKPNYIEFGLLDFKLLMDRPGAETTVVIYLSKPAYKKGNCFKYDPVKRIWLDYSANTEFSPNRKEVYLTIQDGGFGDADGLANGIIVDPLAFGSETDPNGGSSGSPLDELLDGIIPGNLSCFISAAAGTQPMAQPASAWRSASKLGIGAISMLLSLILAALCNPTVAKILFRRRVGNAHPTSAGRTDRLKKSCSIQ
jgi:hypothetical protein